jgi:AcrR family transcriptional regulator
VPKDAKRERILAAATAVFAEHDFHQVQVSHVATRAGVGKGTVYLYFPSKDDLHQAALEASLERLAMDVEQAAAGEAPADAVLREIVLRIMRFFWKRQHLLTLVQRYERRGGRRPRERRHRVLRAVDAVLARHRLGAGGSERHLDAAFLLGLSRAAILEHTPGDRAEAVATRVVRLYLNGLGRTA